MTAAICSTSDISNGGILVNSLKVKKKYIVDAVVILLANLYVFIVDNIVEVSHWLSWVIISASMLFVLRDFHRKGVVGIAVFCAGLILYLYPYLGFSYVEYDISFKYYSLYILIGYLFIILGHSEVDTRQRAGGGSFLTLALFLFPIFILAPYAEVFLLIFWGLALLKLDDVCKDSSRSGMYVYGCCGAVYLALAYYVVLFWGGYGRLNIMILSMAPALVLYLNKRLKIYSWQILLVSMPALIYGLSVRRSEYRFGGAGDFSGGSLAHHLHLMNALQANIGIDGERFFEWLDQLVLFYFNWFPRVLWSDKPLGIGYWFVDEYLGRAGFGDRHNVSLGLWGEHIYLMGSYWFLFGLVMISVVAFTAKFLNKISFYSLPVMVVFYSYFVNLVWGGLASFGSRAWFVILPMIFYLWCGRAGRYLVIKARRLSS